MKNTVLLVVDVQKGLDDPAQGERNNPEAENNIARLLASWRDNGRPIVHIRHCSVEPHSKLRPELPGNAFKDEVLPLEGETRIDKSTNSAFVDTTLHKWLQERRVDSLVITGLTTDHCVSATTRSASDLGYDVTLVADACATFERTSPDGTHFSAEQMHQVHLASLDGEFCNVRNTAALLEAT